jgi:ATP-dependent DNA helicase RecQ
VRRVKGGWTATGAPWRYDRDRYERVAAVRTAEQDAMRAYVATTDCRMEFLRRQLDDPAAAPCGRCDSCAGPLYGTAVDAGTVAAARERLDRPGVVVEPRALWPTAMAALGVPLSGRIPAGEQATEGRALARLTDLGWGTRLRALFQSDGDGPVPDELVGGVVQVLANWGWERRPDAVVALASASRPELVRSLATGIARIGRLPYLGELTSAGHPRGGRANSAQRLAAVHDAFTVPNELAATMSDLDGPVVLLVDDRADTRWTLTVAARLLRRAGADAVLPFVLALEA